MKVRDVLIEGENKKKFPVYGLGINISSFNLVSPKFWFWFSGCEGLESRRNFSGIFSLPTEAKYL